MRTLNVSKFEQEWNHSRQHCILKDLHTVAVVQTVPLCCLGSCSLVFYVRMSISPSLLVRSGLVQVWFSLQAKFNSYELGSAVGRLVFSIFL